MSRTKDPVLNIKITGLRVYGLDSSKTSRLRERRGFCVTLSPTRGGAPFDAELSLSGEFHENIDPFPTFQALPTDTVRLQICLHRTLRRDKCLGHVEESVQILLDEAKSPGGEVSRSLAQPNTTGRTPAFQGRVTFTIQPVSDDGNKSDMSQAVQQATTDAEEMHMPPSMIANMAPTDVPSMSEKISDIANTWGILLDKVQAFVQICDKLAEVHPYAKLAWSAISVIPKAVLQQVERDRNVRLLIETMVGIFDFVEAADPLREIESYSKIIKSMALQVTQCGYFIHHYAKKKGFWLRTLDNSFAKADSQISDFLSQFQELQSAFQLNASREVSIAVVSILDNFKKHDEVLETHVIESTLERMQYSKTARYDPEKQCLPGTRQQIISDIIGWVNNTEGESIFLLSGVAGKGKSAIVHSIAKLFGEQRRLGSSFCFDRNDPNDRRPEQLFCTVARDLAYRDDRIKRALYNTIKEDESVLRSPSPAEQFQRLILGTMEGIEIVGPILVMIDALDESAGASREAVIKVLARGNFPDNFRLLIASRPDNDIVQSLHNSPHTHVRHLDAPELRSTTESDIQAFVESRLTPSNGSGITTAECRDLAVLSGGLFQWAFTVCRFIQPGGSAYGGDPSRKLRQVLELKANRSQMKHLDTLYQTILGYVVDSKDKDHLNEIKLVLGRVLAAIIPLSKASLKELFVEDSSLLDNVLPFLGSLLSGVTEVDSPIRPLHASLRDFLLDKERAGVFFVDTTGSYEEFSHATLRSMVDNLRFNICHTSTSHRRNDQISREDIDKFIPPFLQYACTFWDWHLEIKFTVDLLSKTENFLQSKFLYWLEVLSIIRALDRVAPALSVVIKLAGTLSRRLASSAADAQRFIRVFALPISQSVPHIYLSAWAFSPERYKTGVSFLPKLIPNTIALKAGSSEHWSNLNLRLQGHENWVTSAVFSPYGDRVVSASRDGMIRIWNAETGEELRQPLRDHGVDVTSVAYSRDGRRFFSASTDKTIRIWNADTGEPLGKPLEGHDRWITSVAVFWDCSKIVSGSADKTIRLWDAETGAPLGKPMQGHRDVVTSVACSPVGSKVASASGDKTVRVWNPEAEDVPCTVFRGHNDWVLSVAFSQDGRRLVSGSDDNTIRIWNVDSGEALWKTLRGHESSVTSVVVSPDGAIILSGSNDRTIRVWSGKTGEALGEPLLGHDEPVTSVAFSQDGRRIVSGSYDKTVRVWNAPPVEVSPELLLARAAWVTSVAFSPDGGMIASGSSDKTIRLWVVETGEPSGKPLEGHDDVITSVAFSPKGNQVISAAGSGDKSIRVWNVETGEPLGAVLRGHTDSVTSIALAWDGSRIVSGSADKTIRIWDVETGKLIGEPLRGHDEPVTSVAVSRSGSTIVSSSAYEMTIRIWDASTGEPRGVPLSGHGNFVTPVAISPDGSRIASGSYDETVRLWHTETGQALGEPLRGHNHGVRSVAFSNDGSKIVSGSNDQTVRIWDVETREALGQAMQGHDGAITSVAFSHDMRRVVSGSGDKSIRVWDVEAYVATSRSRDDQAPVSNGGSRGHHVLFSDDGSRLTAAVKLDADGWLVGPNSELLLWIPAELRLSLPIPPVYTIIQSGSNSGCVLFDSSRFSHGTEWIKCNPELK